MSANDQPQVNTLVVLGNDGRFCEVPLSAFADHPVSAARQAELEHELANGSNGSNGSGEVSGYGFPAFNPALTYGYIRLSNNGAYLGSLSGNNQFFVQRTNLPAHLNPTPYAPFRI